MLIDCNIKRTDLVLNNVVSSNVIAKMGKNESVSMDSLLKICSYLNCDIGDIVEMNASRYSLVSENKHNGVVYTPRNMADYLARLLVETKEPKDSINILDPAIGSGELVVALIEEIRKQSSAEITVVGFELDRTIIDQTRDRIEKMSDNIVVRINCSDFIDFAIDNPFPMFDYVIANPPYVRTQIMGSEKAQAISKILDIGGRIDIYYAFLLLTKGLLKQGGIAGYITSNKYMTVRAGSNIREYLYNNTQIRYITDFGDTKLFDAAVLPCITVFSLGETIASDVVFTSIYELKKGRATKISTDIFDSIDCNTICTLEDGRSFEIKRGSLSSKHESDPWTINTEEIGNWIELVRKNTYCVFKDIGKIKVGIKTTADPVFIMESWSGSEPPPELLRPLITHRNAGQIKASNNDLWVVVYPHIDVGGKTKAVNIDEYPLTKKYLEAHREKLEKRKYLADAGRNWYEIWVPQKAACWSDRKIVFRDISEEPQFWLDVSGSVVNGDCYWIDVNKGIPDDMIYLALAVANSKFIEKFYDVSFNNKLYSGKRRYMSQYVEQFPLPDPKKSGSKQAISIVKEIIAEDDSSTVIYLKQRLDSIIEDLFLITDQKNHVEGVFGSLNFEPVHQREVFGQ